jgi:regulator of CtrA degradation
MSKVSKGQLTMRDQRNTNSSGTVNFLSRFQHSDKFDKIFKEGMGLVEETANYLDGQGRVDSRVLDRPGTIAYATESMRLTTRLMQLASWLLLQRAMISGEVNETEARREKSRVNLNDIGAGHDVPGVEQLPEGLIELVDRSLRLHERIKMMDSMSDTKVELAAANENPVALQMDQLMRAFTRG